MPRRERLPAIAFAPEAGDHARPVRLPAAQGRASRRSFAQLRCHVTGGSSWRRSASAAAAGAARAALARRERDRRGTDAAEAGLATDGHRALLQPGASVGLRRRRGARLAGRSRRRAPRSGRACDRVRSRHRPAGARSSWSPSRSSPCPTLPADKVPGKGTFRLVALLGVGMLATLFLLGAPVAAPAHETPAHRVARQAHRTISTACSFARADRSVLVVVLAVAVQLLNVAAMHWCAKGMRLDLDFAASLVIVPAVMLVSMAPISFAGWGVREGAMIVGLGLAGNRGRRCARGVGGVRTASGRARRAWRSRCG